MIYLAHGVGRVYESPLPVWLYGVGAAVTVLLSFILRAAVTTAPREREPRTIIGPGAAGVIVTILQAVGLIGLVLMLMAGALVRDRGLSLAPLMFWIGLIVGTAMLSVVIDGIWRAADPCRSMEDFYRFEPPEERGAPPWWLGPLLLYGLFWFELVSGVGFEALAIVIVLLGYTLFSFTFRYRWGSAWREADPLSVLFGFAGACAPLEIDREGVRY